MARRKRKRIVESPEEMDEHGPPQAEAAVELDLWDQELYLYEPGDAIHLEHLQRIAELLEDTTEHSTSELLLNKNLLSFLGGMSRIQPYCDGNAQTAIGQLNGVWSKRLAAYESEKESEARQSSLSCSMDKVVVVDTPPSKKRGSSHSSSGADTRQRKNRAVGTDKRQENTKQELPTVDETIRPYSAWLLHNDIHQRLLAASRYIADFPSGGIHLSEDPALEIQASKEALALLFQGGPSNIYVGKQFLDAYRQQKRQERLEKKWKRHIAKLTEDQLAACDCDLCVEMKRDKECFDMSEGEE